jgi:hypothetical protein
VLYLAKDARKQRTLSLYFGDDEIARMRDTFGYRTLPNFPGRCAPALRYQFPGSLRSCPAVLIS